MKFGKTDKEKLAVRVWFAWRPVEVEGGGWRWLEPVVRRRYTLHHYFHTYEAIR